MNIKIRTDIETTKIQIGDTVDIILKNGERNKAMAVSETENAFIFCMVDCLNYSMPMYWFYSSGGGYENSHMRVILNNDVYGVLALFPEELYKEMVPFENGDYLCLPSVDDIFGEERVGKSGETYFEKRKQWVPMKSPLNRKCTDGWRPDYYVDWWLRDSRSDGSFRIVDRDGMYVGGCVGTGTAGVRPIFQISKSAVWTSDEHEE